MNIIHVKHPQQFADPMLSREIQPVQLNLGNLTANYDYLAIYELTAANPKPEQYRALLNEHLHDDNAVDCILTQRPINDEGFGTEDYYVRVRTWSVLSSEGANATAARVVTLINLDSPQ